ncbi:MAG: histidine phosphatase family protein [Granulosicoccus sp.]
MRLHLIRHGHTIWNDTGGVAGRTDIDLSESGREAVRKLSRTCSVSAPPGLWYASPLLRTRETSRLLREGISSSGALPDVTLDNRLVELDFGDWEGLTWQAVHQQYQQEMDRWGEDWVNRSPPNGETFAQQAARCTDWLTDMMSSEKDDQDVMVVSHGGSIRALVCYCLGWPLSRAMSFNVDPATATTLDFDRASGTFTVRKINASRLFERV